MTEELQFNFNEEELDKHLDNFASEDLEKRSESVREFMRLFAENAKLKANLNAQIEKNAKLEKPPITKAEIMEIQDTVERQKLISENIHLFQFKKGAK